jgi:hypothetical protein
MAESIFSEPFYVQIPPMRVAKDRVISSNPEEEVIARLTHWAEENGIDTAKSRAFGFDVPVSAEQKTRGLRGYEYWIQVPDTFVVPVPRQARDDNNINPIAENEPVLPAEAGTQFSVFPAQGVLVAPLAMRPPLETAVLIQPVLPAEAGTQFSVLPAEAGTQLKTETGSRSSTGRQETGTPAPSGVVPAKAGTANPNTTPVVPAQAGTHAVLKDNTCGVVPAKAGTPNPENSAPDAEKDGSSCPPSSEGRQIEPFPGGTYIALRITDPFADPSCRIPRGWQTLVKYLQSDAFAKQPQNDTHCSNDECNAPGSCLEEVKTINGVCCMDIYIELVVFC